MYQRDWSAQPLLDHLLHQIHGQGTGMVVQGPELPDLDGDRESSDTSGLPHLALRRHASLEAVLDGPAEAVLAVLTH